MIHNGHNTFARARPRSVAATLHPREVEFLRAVHPIRSSSVVGVLRFEPYSIALSNCKQRPDVLAESTPCAAVSQLS